MPSGSRDASALARLARAEDPGALAAQERDVDGFRSTLTLAVARTTAAIERGDLAAVQRTLEALRGQAEAATRLVARLSAANAAPRLHEDGPAARRLVDVNSLVIESVEASRARLGQEAAIETYLAAPLPPVAGDVTPLRTVLETLQADMAETLGSSGAPRPITVETFRRGGAIRGEAFVEVRITHRAASASAGPGPDPGQAPDAPLAGPVALDVRAVTEIVREHGGVLGVDILAGGGVRFTVVLPAV